MKWKQPPVIKIYEALGAVADERMRTEGNTAKVYSSSGNKFYEVSYDPDTSSIMTNDNGSFWQGYLGYPAIAYLLQTGVLTYDAELGGLLKGIAWKDINTQFKNDFDKTLKHIQSGLAEGEAASLTAYVEQLAEELAALDLNLLGQKKKPPTGY